METVIAVTTAFASVVAILSFFLSIRKNNKTDGKQEGQILTKIDYIQDSVDDIKKILDKQQEATVLLRVEIAEVKKSTELAHDRITRLEMEKHNDK